MAFNTYNNNKDQNKNTTTTYSISFANPDSKVDPTRLVFAFFETNVKISIHPKSANATPEQGMFDKDNGISVYLNANKAKIFANELRMFLQDPVKYNGVGVAVNTGVISISNGVEYGVNAPIITIRRISDTGNVESSFAFEFGSNDSNSSVRNYTGGTSFALETEEYKNNDIITIIDTLDDYYHASNNAIAHTVVKQMSYTMARMSSNISSIANALGVTTGTGSNGGQKRYNNTSYFKNSNGGSGNDYSNNGVSYESVGIDELDD